MVSAELGTFFSVLSVFIVGLNGNWTFRHDDVIKWKHVPRYWPFVRGIHRSPVNSLHKGQWRGALMFSLICVRLNGWVNNREAGDLSRRRAHYDVTVMGTNFSEILVKTRIFSLKKIHSKMFSAKCWPFYSGFSVFVKSLQLGIWKTIWLPFH